MKIFVFFVAFVIAVFLNIQAIAQQVIAENLSVQGSGCIGEDCESSESYNSILLRLKEDRVNIDFMDASTLSGFPTNDWRIKINDDGFDGEEYFMIEDVTGSKSPFRIDAGAPNNSLRIGSDGFLGVNTSQPGLQLHVKGGDSPGLRIEQDMTTGYSAYTWDVGGNETNFFVKDVTNSSTVPFLIKSNSLKSSFVIDDGVVNFNANKLDMDVRINGVDNPDLFFADGGTNQIGIGHANPEELLDVAGNIKSLGFLMPTGAAAGYVLTSDSSGIASWEELMDTASLLSDTDRDTRIEVEKSGDEDHIRFQVAGTEAMIIDDTGQVGIGTLDPMYKLDVEGTIRSTGLILPSGASSGYVLTSDAEGIASWTSPVAGEGDLIEDTDQDTKIQVEESGDEDQIRFDVGGTEAMVIDQSGRVGIGTDQPEHALHVVGDVGMTGAIFGVSDARIKKEVQSIDNALQIIQSLDGKTYYFRCDDFQDLNLPANKQYGLVAQEVEQIVSELVTNQMMSTTDANGNQIVLKGVNYEKIIPILINAIKEQHVIIRDQSKKMDEMLSEQARVVSRLSSLEEIIRTNPK